MWPLQVCPEGGSPGVSARNTELERAAQLSSTQTVGMNLGARNTPPGTCAGQSERASRVSLLWARPSCGPTMCQSPAGHEQWGRGQPPGPWVKMAQGLCSPGPEGVPVPPICVASQSGFFEVPQGERRRRGLPFRGILRV